MTSLPNSIIYGALGMTLFALGYVVALGFGSQSITRIVLGITIGAVIMAGIAGLVFRLRKALAVKNNPDD
ncbi:hypothetical protein [Nitrososphaera sp.]|uniref:hypothetical protein n=1 Tax=Nitrososphaera sp. TaxID=1971748 RepID=UPI0017A772B7|nr:hypothetical protein [Nitrososphaera sp.]NWG38325.1 hypothetical protein [Nitrososphaera sp.]